MTILEAIQLEIETQDLDSADGINVLELIDRHNIEVEGAIAFDDLMDTWREINQN
jgi:hypothetical protein